MNIAQAFAVLTDAQHEGSAFVDDPRDPGGATKFGISQRAYPDLDIASLTADAAQAIYQRDYWSRVQADQLPDAIRFEMFDMAVNQGVAAAIRTMQRALGVAVDGNLGPATLAAAAAADPQTLLRHIQADRLHGYLLSKLWPVFGHGWVQRVAANMGIA